MRKSLGLFLPVSLLWVLAGVAIGCSGGTKTTFVTNMKGKATRTDTVDLALSPGDTLVLVGDPEDIQVRTADRAPRVTAEISVVAYTQEEAETALSAFRVVTRRTSRGLEVKVGGDAGTYVIEGGREVPHRAFTDFTAIVPGGVKVIAESRSGAIEIQRD